MYCIFVSTCISSRVTNKRRIVERVRYKQIIRVQVINNK